MDRRHFLGAAVGTTAALGGCARRDNAADRASVTGEESGSDTGALTLATATTAYDTGLLDVLHAAFERRFGTRVRTLVKGTGAALETARTGDADVVLVHARSAEDAFIREGHGVNRRDLMYNDFLVVGPEDDPAGVADADGPLEALRRIADSEALFLSRGDDSGTHQRERQLWDAAAVEPGGSWYQATGDGMAATLRQAGQRGAYALSDRGTYRVTAGETGLVVHLAGPLSGGSERLRNDYGVVLTNPARHDVNYELATAYLGFLTGSEGQKLIQRHTADDERLFVPNALSATPRFEQYVPTRWASGNDEDDVREHEHASR
ncbi:molybdenum transporter [Haloprofundus marisrubri]|uniref:Molybdenum transporter n=1 Tax=Haloprofundus marisrubri TaxID=1514971 RepID=A0A0W1RA38_9EURY|nr:substrate-binding domain-containing protein [Haloprofundus marisrubri]KTG10154.1 molybdenum transporter [Haloprofundus marisrubri]